VWTWFLILVHYSERSNVNGGGKTPATEHVFLRSTVLIIMVEVIKTVANGVLYFREDPEQNATSLFYLLFSAKMKSLMWNYMPIAILYLIYNNLMFMNLKSNNPVAYQVISSSRLILTTIVWQMTFKGEPISSRRKVAISVIFFGVLVGGKRMTETDLSTSTSFPDSAGNIMLMLLQVSCSVLAGIYNEKHLKHDECSQFLQNMALNITSVGFNTLIIASEIMRLRHGKHLENNILDLGIERFVQPTTFLIVLTLAITGILSSAVLRYEDSVTKGVTSPIVMVAATIIEYFYFEHVFTTEEILSTFLVIVGTILYFVNPFKKAYNYNPSHGLSKKFLLKSTFIIILMAPFFYLLQFQQNYNISVLTSLPRDDIDSQLIKNKKYERECTKHESLQPLFNTTFGNEENKIRINEATHIIEYIIKQLDATFNGAQLALVWGTMLKEYRNGMSPCVQYDPTDKDFDVAVNETTFHHIVNTILPKIEKKFNWKTYVNKERFFAMIFPPDQPRWSRVNHTNSFQIDLYSFKTNTPKKGLVFFPWDKVEMAMDAFLPLVKYKTIATKTIVTHDKDLESGGKQKLYYYKPFNVPCYLSNLFGGDFMIPKPQASGYDKRFAYDHPKCVDMSSTDYERYESQRNSITWSNIG